MGAGILGRNLSSRARRRYSAERISSGAFSREVLVDSVELVSLPGSGLSIPGVLANPAASVPLVKKSLRFTLPSFHSLFTECFRVGSR